MQRSELHTFLLFFTLSLHLVSCSSGGNDADGVEYNVEISFDTDSTVVTENLCLFVDNHRSIKIDTLTLNKNHIANYVGTTAGTDELYLMSNDGNEICHFYTTAGSKVDVIISGKEDSLVISYPSPTDTINSWLQHHSIADVSLDKTELLKQTQRTLDSLKESGEMNLRTALLLRDYIPYLKDSIYVRQYMGGFSGSDKPEWLAKSIDALYPQLRTKNEHGRLSAAQFQMNDTLITISTSSRSDYMLLYFWGDYSQSSVDTLKALSKRIDEDYDDKRLVLLSFCLSAPDSTWWTNNIKDLPVGHHALLPGGMADPRITDWLINQVPYNLVTDMFTNIQSRNTWNEDLNKTLNKIPRRSNVSSRKPRKK